MPYGAKPVHEIPQPFYNAMYTAKVTAELSTNHSLLVRYAGQRTRTTTPPCCNDTNNRNQLYSA